MSSVNDVDSCNDTPSIGVRLGVDIGGTFTDIVLEVGKKRHTSKVLTTHAAPEKGVLDGVRGILSSASVEPREIKLVVHGTTLATNALIERRGARTALLTTEGFRDVVEIRGEDRYEQYDLGIDLPPPLVPRKWRFTVSERVDSRGNVLIPLDEAQIERVAKQISDAGMESLAICFLHSYRFSEHELEAERILTRLLPGLSITLSSQVSPEMREYERFSTACANAYVRPLMSGYLLRLQEQLRDEGIDCPLNLMLSGGGLTTVETSRRFPVRLVESGPAGGAIFSSHVARQCGLDRVLSFDMGGTTAKICLINGGKPLMSRTFEVARVYRFKKGSGLPLRIPVIEMVEIGAGGGSVASVDQLKRVAVGPESAGSEPGPACYGRGGLRPTVTDANVVLGRIDPDAFAGGTYTLDSGSARAALERGVGESLGIGAEMAAWAVSEIVEENMANAARVHAVESGAELTDRTLVAFGGAAPLHALRLAAKLGIDRVIIPSGAGVGSAIGFLQAPISFEIVRSLHALLSGIDLGAADAALREMAEEAHGIVAAAAGDAERTESRVAYMRYAGQGHEIMVPLPSGVLADLGIEKLRSVFDAEYERVYGRHISAGDVEILSWAVTVSSEAASEDTAVHSDPGTRHPAPLGKIGLFDPEVGAAKDAAVYHRADLQHGDTLRGPAVIVEDETTTLIPDEFTATINAWGYIECTRELA